MRAILIILALLLLTAICHADYSINWYTIDGGGRSSSNGPYQLIGTIGQVDAGYHGGGQYEMLGGFLVGGPLCVVNLEHFATFAAHWLEGPCDAGDNWCGGADLDKLGDVNVIDLEILASHWLNTCPFDWPW